MAYETRDEFKTMREKIENNKTSFTNLTYKYYENVTDCHDKGEDLSTVVWAAVFVESMVKSLLTILNPDFSENELGRMIYYLRGLGMKKHPELNIPNEERKRMKNIGDRSDEIRIKRNRLLHDTECDRYGLESDGLDCYKNVLTICVLYLDSQTCAGIRSRLENNESGKKKVEPYFPVFISTITVHSAKQKRFLEEIEQRLREIGVKPVRVTFDSYDEKDPVGKVRSTIQRCEAAIVIGLERTHSYYLKDKEYSDKEKEELHRKYTSGWLNLEAGCAAGLNKKIFVMCQKNLYSDGIFDRGWHSYPVLEFDPDLEITDPVINTLVRDVEKYMKERSREDEWQM